MKSKLYAIVLFGLILCMFLVPYVTVKSNPYISTKSMNQSVKLPGITPSINFDVEEQYNSAYFEELEERMYKARTIVYNRVPKCGGRATSEILTLLSNSRNAQLSSILAALNSSASHSVCGSNNATKEAKVLQSTQYSHEKHPFSVIGRLGAPMYQCPRGNCTILASKLGHRDKPWIYHWHLHFVQFDHYGLDMPLYVNIIRHPVDRFVSQFYFSRNCRNSKKNSSYAKTFDECVLNDYAECTKPSNFIYIISFFCGQSAICHKPSREALNIAKQNVNKYFGVIGLAEDLTGTYALLEKTIPYFCQNMSAVGDVYLRTMEEKYKTVDKVTSNQKAMTEMANRMKLELEFYNFIKHRYFTFLRHYNMTSKLLNTT